MNFSHSTAQQRHRWKEALALYQSGKLLREIAMVYGVAVSTVQRWIVRAEKQRVYEKSLRRKK